MRFLQNHPLDIVFLDLKSAQTESLKLLRQLKHDPPPMPVLAVGIELAGELAGEPLADPSRI